MTDMDNLVSPENTEKSEKSLYPLILIIMGIFESLQPLAMTFLVIPQLAVLYDNLNISGFNPLVSYGLIGGVAAIALAQVVYGAVLMVKQESKGSILDSQKTVAKALLVIGALAFISSIPIIIIYVISPIYNLINFIK